VFEEALIKTLKYVSFGFGVEGVPLGLFLILVVQGLDTEMVCWQSTLKRAFTKVPERLFVLVAASHSPQLPNLYLQSAA